MRTMLKLICTVVSCFLVSVSAFSEWGKLISDIEGGILSDDDFRSRIEPLAQATKVSYTGEEESPDERVVGFCLVERLRPEIGLNALVFLAESEDDKRMLIAFRGTKSESDSCADDLFWKSDKPLEEKCRKFPPSALNYWSQGLKFTSKMLERYPGRETMFTGHSLGASMSHLMTAELMRQGKTDVFALCFAPAGVVAILKRHGLNSTSVIRNSHHLLSIVNPFDPVFAFSENEEIGKICTLDDAKEPLFCYCCHKENVIDLVKEVELSKKVIPDTLNKFCCRECFIFAHRYKRYLDLLFHAPDVPDCKRSSLQSIS